MQRDIRGHEPPLIGASDPDLHRQVVSVRLPAYLVHALDRCADAQMLSRSHVVRTILRAWSEGRPLPSSDADQAAQDARGRIV
jgi:Arc/MetJ-type ribon-helix-helix transcriptional regulator